MQKYNRNNQLIDGELDNNQIMMDLENGKYYGLNPVGKRIWELIEQPKTFDQIIESLLSEFEVSEIQCKQETELFLEKAVLNKLIVIGE